jgi:hypothetical protein
VRKVANKTGFRKAKHNGETAVPKVCSVVRVTAVVSQKLDGRKDFSRAEKKTRKENQKGNDLCLCIRLSTSKDKLQAYTSLGCN